MTANAQQPVYYLDANGNVISPGGGNSGVVTNSVPSTNFNTPMISVQPNNGSDGLIPWNNMSIVDIVQMFIVYAFVLAALFSAVMIVYGGLQYISGNKDKGQEGVRSALIGFIIVLLSFTIIAIIARFFDLDLLSYLSFDGIREGIRNLVETAKGNSTGNSDVFFVQ